MLTKAALFPATLVSLAEQAKALCHLAARETYVCSDLDALTGLREAFDSFFREALSEAPTCAPGASRC